MDPKTPKSQQEPLPVQEGDVVHSDSNNEPGSHSGLVSSRPHPSNESNGSPQPSPLSQSAPAADTTTESASSAIDLRTEPQLSAPEGDPSSNAPRRFSDPPPIETTKPTARAAAAVLQEQEPDAVPPTSSFNRNTSPDEGLEKEYHTEKRSRRPDSDEDSNESAGDEDQGPRGRQRSREKKHYRTVSDVSASDTDGGSAAEAANGRKKPPRKLKTFEPLREKKERAKAALESEPTVTITGPGGEKITVKKGPVHPDTNYDRIGSRGVSPDSEELRDIKHAQSLALYASPIDNITPHRVIRTVLRGDYRGIQKEAKAKKRKLRTYFVATDISEEAAYALEWTIGTVLRDGDTLLAIYAVNKDTGTGETGDPERIDGLELSEGALAMQDTTATMEKMTSEAPQPPVSPAASGGGGALAAIGLGPKARRDSDRGSKDSRVRTKGEAERLHAIDVISETCINFLRKTRLQVRVTVEVISCKSPRHMITEAIDYFEPTLVILGSRGRGALKGTLLGSFSNYLVAKSSIPVMVARKKLKGRKATNVNPTVRLANNLVPTTDSRLTRARID
ncbi:MAG: hypothetical protein LQ345_000944 [Seirophora villosa]|nr:MAG: hypothetical protein LQ345_000944 [Seirophora villosa]